jgi:hypothetical protein
VIETAEVHAAVDVAPAVHRRAVLVPAVDVAGERAL